MTRESGIKDQDMEKGGVIRKTCKAKVAKSKLSYCQRLALSLDSADAASKNLSPKHQQGPSHSPFLALPPEIRQHILYNIYDDDEILALDVDTQTHHLKRICKTFEGDVEHVTRQWSARREKLLKARQIREGAFDSYIADLMGPLIASSEALEKRQTIRGFHSDRHGRGRRADWDQKVLEKKMARCKGPYRREQRRWNVVSDAERVETES